MTNERVHTLARTVVARKEAKIVDALAKKTEGDNPSEESIDNLVKELKRQDPRGKVDEEEATIQLIEKRKRKK